MRQHINDISAIEMSPKDLVISIMNGSIVQCVSVACELLSAGIHTERRYVAIEMLHTDLAVSSMKCGLI